MLTDQVWKPLQANKLHDKISLTKFQDKHYRQRGGSELQALSNTTLKHRTTQKFLLFFIIIINPLTVRVVGAPQMIFQPAFSIFPCSPLPSGTGELQACSFPDVVFPPLPLSALSSYPFHRAFARWFCPVLMNRRHDHTTAVCISLWSSGGLHVVHLPAGSWHRLPHW